MRPPRGVAMVSALALVVPSAAAEPDRARAAAVSPLSPFISEDELLASLDRAAGAEVIELEGVAPTLPATASERTLDEETLATTPRRSAEDLLRAVPGLYLSSHGAEGKAQQFFLRGFDAVHGSDLELRVAGIAINEHSNVHGHGYVDLGFVIPEIVAEVRAREGSFALDQGDFATAGTVGLELGTSRRGARAGYEAGTTNRHRLVGVLAPEGGPREQVIAVEAMRDDGYGENRASERLSAIAQHRFAVGGGGGWVQPLALAYAATFGEPGVLPLADVRAGAAEFDDAYATGRGASRRLLVGVRGRRGRATGGLWLGWRGLSLDENFTGYLLHEDEGDRRLQEHAATTAGGDGEWRRALAPTLDLVVGAGARVESLHQIEDGLTVDGAPWQRSRSLRATTLAGGARAGLEVHRGPLRAAVGARLDALAVDAHDLVTGMDGAGEVAALSPRATLAWERARVGVFAAYGRGLRSPEARAFTPRPEDTSDMDLRVYDGGEAAITTSDAVELGARVTSGALALHAAAFATFIDREALFDHVSGVNVELDGTRRLGGELAVAWQPAEWLSLRGDVTAVDARFAVTGNAVPGAPRLLAQGEAHVDRGPWRAGVHVTYVGARPLAHGATGAATALVDAIAGWRGRHVEVGLQLDNVLGQRWHEGEYHFASRWDRSAPRSTLPRIHYSAGRPFGARVAITMLF